MTGLIVQNLDVALSGQSLVRDITFSAPVGAVTGLIGPNGAGKSTLMRAMLGLGPIGGGTVHFGGEDLLALPARQRAQRVAFVEQSNTTEARLAVGDVVLLGRIPFQSVWQFAPSAADVAMVEAALAAVGMLAFRDRLYHTLSGGEQQRVQIARALAQEPRLLVLDEPTSHLDIHAQLTMLDLLQQRARAGMTVVLALHDLNLAAAYCDQLVVLHGGATAAQGNPSEVLSPSLLKAVYGVAASVLPHPATGKPLIAYDLPAAE
ncbi:MAG TPA: ABC transporter ATP-binding protein [Devosia sp.]|jgi:iron complex transport system ATP-binding protein|uniref:ABC transporter ATP-binding protein n=1 Tax=Devosia sp. TaxID=1871048 RepID=UPI002F9320FD